MDELAQDLSSALDESYSSRTTKKTYHSSLISQGVTRRYSRRRRRRMQRINSNVYCRRRTISGSQESNVDSVVKDFRSHSAVMTFSDSDDLAVAFTKQRLTNLLSEPAASVESHSFPRTFTSVKPQRRRRKFKSSTPSSSRSLHGIGECLDQGSKNPNINAVTAVLSAPVAAEHKQNDLTSAGATAGNSCGMVQSIVEKKRKHASRSRSSGTRTNQGSDLWSGSREEENMDVTSVSHESSLSSSEFDSDVHNNVDEGREADDEQSDFFHEAGPAYGVPQILPWYGRHAAKMDRSLTPQEAKFNSLLTGALSYISKSSSRSLRHRVDKMIARAKDGERKIQFGRTLKGNVADYTKMHLLQDQDRWSCMQTTSPAASQGPTSTLGYNSHSSDSKCLWQTWPPPLTNYGCVGRGNSTFPVADVSRNWLQGWTPAVGQVNVGPATDKWQQPTMLPKRHRQKYVCHESPSDS